MLDAAMVTGCESRCEVEGAVHAVIDDGAAMVTGCESRCEVTSSIPAFECARPQW